MTAPELPVPDLTLLRLAEHAERLDVLDAAVSEMAGRLAELLEDAGDGPAGKGYTPIAAPRWWRLSGEARDAATARLAAWAEQVLRPAYGTLGTLPACWPEHPLALATLDWLSELHSVLYLQPSRSPSMLAGQAEWQTRLLPAALEQIHRECSSCAHRRSPR